MTRLRQTFDHDPLEGIAHVDRMATWARRFITAVTATLGVFFAWIQLRDIPFRDLAEKTSPEAITTTALILYYACWLAGSNFDVKVQQKVYATDPRQGKMSFDTFAIVTLFALITVLLLYVSKDTKAFAVVLAFFVVANIFGWRHIISRVKPAITKSRTIYRERKNYFRLEQLSAVEMYMAGRWQVHRFRSMLAIVVVVNLICLVDSVRSSIASMISWIGIDLPHDTIASLLPSISILAFVLFAETWIWIKRIAVSSALRVLDDLREKYVLNEK